MDERELKALIVGAFTSTPGHHDAAGLRVSAVSKLFELNAIRADFFGTTSVVNAWDEDSNFPRRMSISSFFWLDRAGIQLIRKLREGDYTHVVMYGSHNGFFTGPLLIVLLSFLLKYKVFIDVVDTLAPTQRSTILRYIKLVDEYIWKFAIPKIFSLGVIVISRNLLRFYSSLDTILIPPLETNEMRVTASGRNVTLSRHNKIASDPLCLLYTGFPFSANVRSEAEYKDRLDIIIDAVVSSDRLIKMLIAGISKAEYLTVVTRHQGVDFSRKNIVFLGRVDREELRQYYNIADFTVLMRNQSEASNNGFPTKVIESVVNGVPVIANDTSDIFEVLGDLVVRSGDTVTDLCCILSSIEPVYQFNIPPIVMPDYHAPRFLKFLANERY